MAIGEWAICVITRGMNPTSDQILNLGVLGLGQSWQQHWKPVLESAANRYRICAVYDTIDRVTQDEAQLLRCQPCESLQRLLDHPDLDVLFFCDPLWMRFWPMVEACRAGRPVLSALPLCCDFEHGQALIDAMDQASRVVHWFHPLADCSPLLEFQNEIQQLGPVHYFAGQARVPPTDDLLVAMSKLIEGCLPLFPSWPSHVQAVGPRSYSLPIGSGLVAYGEDWEAHISVLQVTEPLTNANSVRYSLEVLAERGEGQLHWPDIYEIQRPGESRRRTMQPEPIISQVIHKFYDMVWQGEVDQANQKIAVNAFRLLHAAWQSAETFGRIVEVTNYQ